MRDLRRLGAELWLLRKGLFLTPSPTIPTLAEQCAARGEPVPVGETARAIRDRGYVVSPIVPDETPLILSEEGSRVDTTSTGKFTGYAFRVHVRDYAHRVVRSSGALKHASHHEIERLFERIAEWLSAEILDGYVPSDIDTLTVALRFLREEASRRESALEARASISLAN